MSDPSILDELLLRWQESRRHGRTLSIPELCAEHPSLETELTARIAAFESMELMLGLESAAHSSNGDSPEMAPHHDERVVPAHLADKLRPLGYELLELIDHGGMGVVYKAVQIELRRTVALKMIAGLRVGAKQAARFRVEAEAVARLHHPNIVQIYDVGVVDGHSYFTMEYVDGGTLAHQIASGPLPPHTAAQLVETLARAVHHAHERDIVHRDLKPANILLSNVGFGMRNAESTGEEKSGGPVLHSAFGIPYSALFPKVSDFGLAKRLGAETDHTATGEVIGTPAYMAPEQAEGKTTTIGPACDVYALGAILYESLTGRPPFKGHSVLETLRQVIADEPCAPRRVRPGIPRDLEAICLKCLEKKPPRRYASAEALANDLRRFANHEPVTARRLSSLGRLLKLTRRRPVWTASMLLIVVASAGFAAQRYAEREQARARTEAEQERKRARAVEVAPQAREILHRHCYECHGANPARVKRGFLVLDRASLFDPERKNVVAGRPEDSRLIHRIEDNTMPPEEDDHWLPRVSERELSILKDWIAGGAPEFPPEDPLNPTPPAVPRSELAVKTYAIFLRRCQTCHPVTKGGGKPPDGGIKILNHNLLLARKVVVPGQPEGSEVYALLLKELTHELVMPPATEPRMSKEEIETIRRWIEEGAPPFPHTK